MGETIFPPCAPFEAEKKSLGAARRDFSHFAFGGEVEDFDEQLERLKTTQDNFERNHLAMDLATTRRPEVLEVLIDLIRRPDLKNNRGTLVYSLEPYDCRSHLSFLVKSLPKGNWEVAHGAALIIMNLLPLNQAEFEFLRASYDELMAVTFSDHWRNDLISDLSADLRVW